jgi:hypothetical protein
MGVAMPAQKNGVRPGDEAVGATGFILATN